MMLASNAAVLWLANGSAAMPGPRATDMLLPLRYTSTGCAWATTLAPASRQADNRACVCVS